jgi:hypothetical protein
VVERLEIPKLRLTLQPKVEARVKVTPIRAITQPLTELELQQPRRTIRGD